MTQNYISPTFLKPMPPGDQDLLDAVKQEVAKNMNCVKIGVIQSFDAEKQEAIVKVAFQQVTSIQADGTRTLAEYPLCARVPVQYPSGGGFTLTFPVAAGDECILLFNDRQIDNWLTNGAGLPPSMGRVHDISDAIAIVGIRNNKRALADVSTNSAQLRSDDGGTLIEVAGGGIVNVIAPGGMTFTTPQLVVTGDVIAGDDAISLVHHVHNGVQSGGSNTGEPVP